ncbi:hypothetical protein IWW36_004530, partial [Coemansia brasiliensis]
MKAAILFKNVSKRIVTRLIEKVAYFKQAHRLVVHQHVTRNEVATDIASTANAAHPTSSTAAANAAPAADPATTINSTSVANSATVIHSTNLTKSALNKEKARLEKAYAAAVKQRNADVLAANIAAGRVLTARYNSLIEGRPAGRFERTARKLQVQRQKMAQENQTTLDLQDELSKLNMANKLAEIKLEDTNKNIQFFQKEREEQPRRIGNLSQKLTESLIICKQARDERDRLSQ